MVISWCNCLSSLVIISSSLIGSANRFSSKSRGVPQARYYFLSQVHLLGLELQVLLSGEVHLLGLGIILLLGLLSMVKATRRFEKTITPRPEPEPRSGWLGVHRILLNIYPNFPDLNLIPRESSGLGLVWDSLGSGFKPSQISNSSIS